MSIPAPPARLESPLAAPLRAAILQEAPPPWIEKVRRFVGVHGRNLRAESLRRFGASSASHVSWMAELLLQAAAGKGPNGPPCEPALLSAAWYALDADGRSSDSLRTRAEALTQALSEWHRNGGTQPPYAVQGPEFDYTRRWRDEARSAAPVLIISPSRFSLYSLAVLTLCIRLDVPVAGVVIRRFTLARATQEYRRDGPRLVRKVWRKLILRSDENADDSILSQRKLIRALQVREHHLARLARLQGVPVLEVADLNAPSVCDWVSAREPTVGLFTGGGLLRGALLERFPTSVINVHMGQLPQYKGMDVVEWPLLEGRGGNVGATAHLMDGGVDTGAVLQHLPVHVQHFATLGGLRNYMLGIMPLLCIDSALGLASGRLRALPQTPAGQQYFFVNPRLLPMVTGALRSGFQPNAAEGPDIYAAMLQDLDT